MPLSSVDKTAVLSTTCLLQTASGLAVSEQKELSQGGVKQHGNVEEEYFARLHVNKADPMQV
jgi:hypothetical protein